MTGSIAVDDWPPLQLCSARRVDRPTCRGVCRPRRSFTRLIAAATMIIVTSHGCLAACAKPNFAVMADSFLEIAVTT